MLWKMGSEYCIWFTYERAKRACRFFLFFEKGPFIWKSPELLSFFSKIEDFRLEISNISLNSIKIGFYKRHVSLLISLYCPLSYWNLIKNKMTSFHVKIMISFFCTPINHYASFNLFKKWKPKHKKLSIFIADIKIIKHKKEFCFFEKLCKNWTIPNFDD